MEQSYTKPSKIIDYNKAFRLGCGRHTMSKFGLCRVPTSGWFISNKGLRIPSVYRNGRGMNLTSQRFVRSSHKILSYRFAPHLSLHYLSTQRPITNTIELRSPERKRYSTTRIGTPPCRYPFRIFFSTNLILIERQPAYHHKTCLQTPGPATTYRGHILP